MSEASRPKPIRLTCPTCGQLFSMDQTPAMPFCSRRCSLVDLGRWVNEEIGLPYEGNPGDAPDDYADET